MVAKRKATIARKKAEAATEAAAEPIDEEEVERLQRAMPAEEPRTLADLGLAAEPEDDLRLDDILTNEEIEAIKAKALEDALKQRRQERAKKFLALATEEARRKLDMVPPDEAREKEMAEVVSIRINMPRHRLANGREAQPDPIIIDQRMYVHGHTYQVPRVQAEYITSQQFLSWQHMACVDGRSRTYYSEQLGTMMHQGGIASGGPGGPSFEAINRRPT